MAEQRPRWSWNTKLLVTILMVALVIYLLFRFSVILPPLIVAVILAYIISPMAGYLQRRTGAWRGLSVFLAYLAMLAAVAALLMAVIPVLATQVRDLNLDIQLFLRALTNLLGHRYQVAGQVIDLDQVLDQLVPSLQLGLEPLFGRTLEFAVDLITSLVWAIFIVVVSFYLVRDADKLRAWSESLLPPAYRGDFILLREEISLIWASFFRGQLVLATVVASLFTLFGLLLGLPFSLALGVLAGLLEFLPSVGHGIWMVTAGLLALFLGSTWLPLPNWAFMLLVIGLHMVFQQFDLNYLIPRIIGRSVHLPPLVVILGIVAGAVLAGVLGILLAAPTIASARVISRYLFANLMDMEPFPSRVVEALPPPNPQWWRKFSTRFHLPKRARGTKS